jgi:hypothetical protein
MTSDCHHDWRVYGRGTFESKQVFLECPLCAALAYFVGTEEEWHYARDAHEQLYPFDDSERIVDRGARGVVEELLLKRRR